MTVYLVCGAPCSGKSTWIAQHAKRGDVICDVDAIYSAISGQDAHDADLHVHEIALSLKERLLDAVRDRVGFEDAYVTSIVNTCEKIHADMERVMADELVLIDTPYDVCMERASERPEYFKFLIQEWFSHD